LNFLDKQIITLTIFRAAVTIAIGFLGKNSLINNLIDRQVLQHVLILKIIHNFFDDRRAD